MGGTRGFEGGSFIAIGFRLKFVNMGCMLTHLLLACPDRDCPPVPVKAKIIPVLTSHTDEEPLKSISSR
jgi:hypothetical protein